MGRTNTDPYTRFDGGFYRKSSTNDNTTGYLCKRYLNNEGDWTPSHSKQYKRCPGHLIVVKGGGDDGGDLVYFKSQHECYTNDIIQKSLGPRMVTGIPDTRPLLTKIVPNVPFCGLSNNIIDSLKNKLSEATGWSPLVGNTNYDRWYYPKLEKDIDLYKYIKNVVKWYLSEIKIKYPALNISSLGLIRSAPLARSQYDGFSHRLHSDYPPNVNVLDLPLRPLSFIIALDEFDFMWLPHRTAKRCDIVTETIKPGQMILFSNNCLHAGGANIHNKYCYRIFGYICANQFDITVGKVFPYKWSSQDDDAVIIEDDDNERIVNEGKSGRLRTKTNLYSP